MDMHLFLIVNHLVSFYATCCMNYIHFFPFQGDKRPFRFPWHKYRAFSVWYRTEEQDPYKHAMEIHSENECQTEEIRDRF